MSKRFPRAESEIATLAERVAEGLAKAAEDFPTPPVSAVDLKAMLDAFRVADTTMVAGRDAYLQQHAAKDAALATLTDALKADLRYAEVAVRNEPEKLNALGWRVARNGSRLEPERHRHGGVVAPVW